MNTEIWVNKGYRYWIGGVASGFDDFAALKGGVHVVDCAFFTPWGGWSLEPVSIYYAGYRPESGYKNRYFGLFPNFEQKNFVTIFDADRIEEIRFAGVVVESSGEFVFSRWRHDYRQAVTAPIYVDGGLDYFRVVGSDLPIAQYANGDCEYCGHDAQFKKARFAVFGVRDGQFVEIT